ncbi:MAG: hypothetical protein IH597_13615 [Bacteroidales bacterium]|nr:hypothetical protein [Bacteroidales bacterium]
MEKSIENIWKEGFLKSDALVAPKINSLYTRKSIHIIDKFKRMFRINLIAIVAFSFAFLIVSWLLHIQVMGVLFFVTLMVLVFINKRLLNDLEKINQGQNSYQYLKNFSHWIKKQIAINKRIATFIYPVFFMSFILGFWFNNVKDVYLGERIVRELLHVYPGTYLIYGVPLVGIIIAILIMAALAYYGARIYLWDLNVIFGNVLKKLDELLTDLESLGN